MLFVNDRQQKNENNLLSVNKTAVWHSCTTYVNVTWIVANAHILQRNAIFVCFLFWAIVNETSKFSILIIFLMATNLVQSTPLHFCLQIIAFGLRQGTFFQYSLISNGTYTNYLKLWYKFSVKICFSIIAGKSIWKNNSDLPMKNG